MDYSVSLVIPFFVFSHKIPVVLYNVEHLNESKLNLIKNNSTLLTNLKTQSIVEYLNDDGVITKKFSTPVFKDTFLMPTISDHPEIIEHQILHRKNESINNEKLANILKDFKNTKNVSNKNVQKLCSVTKISISLVDYYLFKFLTLFTSNYKLEFVFSEFEYIPIPVQIFLHLPLMISIIALICILFKYEPRINREMILYEINNIPVEIYSESKFHNQTSCTICLEQFVNCDEVKVLHCSHIFHKECLDGWLLNSLYCPICRKSCSELTETASYSASPSFITSI